MESASLLNQADWEHGLTNGQARAAELFGRAETEQKRLGYFHTLKEICQQPWTWLRTCDRMIASRDSLKKDVAGILNPALTGPRSSKDAPQYLRCPRLKKIWVPTKILLVRPFRDYLVRET